MREWTRHKQTYAQLAEKYHCSIRTIQRKIDSYRITPPDKPPHPIILLMDTTYWGRGFGIMLFKDAISGDNLLKYYVQYETNAKYWVGLLPNVQVETNLGAGSTFQGEINASAWESIGDRPYLGTQFIVGARWYPKAAFKGFGLIDKKTG